MERARSAISHAAKMDDGFTENVYQHRKVYRGKFSSCLRLSSTLSDSSPHFDENASAAPGISPGVVEDSELLLREMFNPHHVKDGKILETAISLDDLLTRGFSVHRIMYVTREFVKKSMKERFSRPRRGPAWKDEGVARLQTSAVRRLRIDKQQALVVIDTADANNRGHASIYAAAPTKGKAHARELRSLLLPLLQERMSVDRAFE